MSQIHPPLPEKMSVGWTYATMCCPMDADPKRWRERLRSRLKARKKKTLRTHRTGARGKREPGARARSNLAGSVFLYCRQPLHFSTNFHLTCCRQVQSSAHVQPVEQT